MSGVLVRGGLLSVNFCVYSFLYFVDLILKECDIAQQVFLIIIGNRVVRPVMTMCILITMFESIRLWLMICLLMIRRFWVMVMVVTRVVVIVSVVVVIWVVMMGIVVITVVIVWNVVAVVIRVMIWIWMVTVVTMVTMVIIVRWCDFMKEVQIWIVWRLVESTLVQRTQVKNVWVETDVIVIRITTIRTEIKSKPSVMIVKGWWTTVAMHMSMGTTARRLWCSNNNLFRRWRRMDSSISNVSILSSFDSFKFCLNISPDCFKIITISRSNHFQRAS